MDDNTQGFGGSLGNRDLVMLGSVEELVKVFNTNIETGLTDDQVQERRGPRWELGEYSQDHDGRRIKNVVLVRRNGTVVEVSPVDLVYEDIVEVKVKHPVPMGWWDNTGEYNDDYFGERIPADIRIIESDGFHVQRHNNDKNILTLTVTLFFRWTSLDLTETIVPRRKGQESVKETLLKQQILLFTTAGQFLDGALVLSTAQERRKRNIFTSLEHFE